MRNLRHILLFLLGASLPFSNMAISFAGRNWSLGLISSALYFFAMASDFPKIIRVPRIYGRYVLNLFVFAVILTIANFFNANYYGTPVLPTTNFLCAILFIILLLHDILDRGVILKCMYGIAAGSILMSVFFLMGFGASVTSDDGNQLVMFGENPNILGIYMAIGSMVILYEWILQDKLKLKAFRLVFFIAYVPLIILLFATGSRVAFLIFASSLLVTLLLMKTKKNIIKLLLFSIIGIGAIYVSHRFVESDLIIAKRLMATFTEGDVSGRDNIFKSLWPYMVDNMIFGVGETGYVEISKQALRKITMSGEVMYGYSPHNVLLELLLYTGIFGFMLYIVFWYKIYRCSVCSYRLNSNLLPLLCLIPIIGSIFSAQILTAKWAFIMYAYIISVGTEYNNNRNFMSRN